jgi:hypothetical protein
MGRNRRLLAITICCAGLSVALRADEQRTSDEVWELKHSDATNAEFEHREKLIKAELATGAVPEWAGEYGFGDGLGVNIRMALAPQGGFIYSWHGCLGLYDRNYGKVTAKDGRLVFNLELPNDKRGFSIRSETYVPVRWGERHYLLGEDEARDFANAINAGREPCGEFCSEFLIRAGDEKKAVAGRPELPPDIARYLLEKPIAAKIVRVIESKVVDDEVPEIKWRVTRVQIGAGLEQGVWEGMEFHPLATAYTGWPFTVVQVNATHSIAVTRQFDDQDVPEFANLCISTRPGGGSSCTREVRDSPGASVASNLTTR